MREQDLQTLEFDKVLSLLATCALSSVGREACLALRPETTPDAVTAHAERTWQFFRLLGRTVTFPFRSFPDIRPALPQGARVLAQAIAKLEETRTALERERTLAAAEREQVEALRARHQALVTALEREQQVLQEKLTEAEALVRRLRHKGRASEASLCDHFGDASGEWRNTEEALKQSARQQENVTRARAETLPPVSPERSPLLQVGDQVETQDGRIRGELVAVHGGRAHIRHGGVTFNVAITQVRKTL